MGPTYPRARIDGDSLLTTFMRAHPTAVMTVQVFGPKPSDHPTVGQQCPSCSSLLNEGDYTTLVPLGPGGDEEAREKMNSGHWYNAVALEVHFTCYTGINDEYLGG